MNVKLSDNPMFVYQPESIDIKNVESIDIKNTESIDIKNVLNKLDIKKIQSVLDKLFTNKDPNIIYNFLLKFYENIKNATIIKSKNKSEIDTLNTIFKKFFYHVKEYLILQPEYTDTIPEYAEKIQEIELLINAGKERNQVLQLFNEPYDFNAYIPFRTKIQCMHITNIHKLTKKGESNSKIYKASYNGKSCYIKVFKSKFINTNDNLVYEQKIYRYIKDRNDKLKPYYENYFVKVYDVFKMKKSEFINLKNNNNSMYTIFNLINYNYYLIITEDIEGITYGEFLNNNIEQTSLVVNTLFDIIYGIYIMNDKLKIYHNDTHFGNILIKTDIISTINKYQIDKIEYSKEVNYRICFYDFDFSYLENELNPSNLHNSIPQNKKSASDIWFLVRNLYRYNYDYNKIHRSTLNVINTNIYNFIIKVILNNNTTTTSSYINSYSNKNIKCNIKYKELYIIDYYCNPSIRYKCDVPHHPELYAINVLYRFLNNTEFSNFLDLHVENPFYNKYIKYKYKYKYKKYNTLYGL